MITAIQINFQSSNTVNSHLLPALDYNPLLLTTRIFVQKLNILLSKNTPLSSTTLIRDRQKTYYPRVVSAILRYITAI